jgi:hypothetical protein
MKVYKQEMPSLSTESKWEATVSRIKRFFSSFCHEKIRGAANYRIICGE